MIFRNTHCSKEGPEGDTVADFCIWSHSEKDHKNKFTPDNGFLFRISVQELAINRSLLRALWLVDVFAVDYALEYGTWKEKAKAKAVDFFRIYLTNLSETAPVLEPDDILFISVLCLEKQKEILKILGREYDPFDERAAANYAAFRNTMKPIKKKVELPKHLAQ